MPKIFYIFFFSLLGGVLFAQHNAFVLAGEVNLEVEESSLKPDQQSASSELMRRGGLILVKGSLNGAEQGWLILDTGAPGLLINDPTVSAQQADGLIGGATGQTPFQERKLEKLQVAELTQKNVSALAIDMSFAEAQLGVKILGVIGYAQLKDFPVHVSLLQKSIRFGESNMTDDEEMLKASYNFTLTGHLPILEVNLGRQSLDFVFDTGSGVNVIDQAYFESMEGEIRGRPATKRFAGIDNNPVDVPCALVRSTVIENEAHSNKAFLFVNLSDVQTEAPNVAGLLGPAFWKNQSFTIDYQRNQLIAYK